MHCWEHVPRNQSYIVQLYCESNLDCRQFHKIENLLHAMPQSMKSFIVGTLIPPGVDAKNSSASCQCNSTWVSTWGDFLLHYLVSSDIMDMVREKQSSTDSIEIILLINYIYIYCLFIIIHDKTRRHFHRGRSLFGNKKNLTVRIIANSLSMSHEVRVNPILMRVGE